MEDFVSRDVVLEIVKRTSGDYASAFSEILKIPAANVAPIVYGEWIYQFYIDPYGNKWEMFKCSLCGRFVSEKYPYCHCGALMKGD